MRLSSPWFATTRLMNEIRAACARAESSRLSVKAQESQPRARRDEVVAQRQTIRAGS